MHFYIITIFRTVHFYGYKFNFQIKILPFIYIFGLKKIINEPTCICKDFCDVLNQQKYWRIFVVFFRRKRLEILKQESGVKWDPAVVEALLKIC